MIVYIFLFVTALFGSNRDLNDSDKEDPSFKFPTLSGFSPNQVSHSNNEIVPDKKELPGLPLEVWNIIFDYLNQNELSLGSITSQGGTVGKMNFGHFNKNMFSLVSTTFEDILNRATQYVKLRERSNLVNIPSLFGRFPNVKRIKLPTGLSKSHANSIMSNLFLLTNIQELDLERSSNIKDADLAHLSLFTNMRELNLSFCSNITDAGLSHLSLLNNIRELSLSGCEKITGAALTYLSLLTNIQKLNLSGLWKITHVGLSHLSLLTNIRELNLRLCDGITNRGLLHSSQLINLKNIDLENVCRITDAGISHLSGLTKIRGINLRECQEITDAGLSHLSGLKKLKYISINSPKVTERGKQELKQKIPNLKIYL